MDARAALKEAVATYLCVRQAVDSARGDLPDSLPCTQPVTQPVVDPRPIPTPARASAARTEYLGRARFGGVVVPLPPGVRIERQELWHCAKHAVRNATQEFEAMTVQLLIQGARKAAWEKREPLLYHYDPARKDGFSIEAVVEAAIAAGYLLEPVEQDIRESAAPSSDLCGRLFRHMSAQNGTQSALGLLMHVTGHYVALRQLGSNSDSVIVLDSCYPCTVEILTLDLLHRALAQTQERTVGGQTSEFPLYEVFRVSRGTPGVCPAASAAYARGVPVVPHGCWLKSGKFQWEAGRPLLSSPQASPEHNAAERFIGSPAGIHPAEPTTPATQTTPEQSNDADLSREAGCASATCPAKVAPTAAAAPNVNISAIDFSTAGSEKKAEEMAAKLAADARDNYVLELEVAFQQKQRLQRDSDRDEDRGQEEAWAIEDGPVQAVVAKRRKTEKARTEVLEKNRQTTQAAYDTALDDWREKDGTLNIWQKDPKDITPAQLRAQVQAVKIARAELSSSRKARDAAQRLAKEAAKEATANQDADDLAARASLLDRKAIRARVQSQREAAYARESKAHSKEVKEAKAMFNAQLPLAKSAAAAAWQATRRSGVVHQKLTGCALQYVPVEHRDRDLVWDAVLEDPSSLQHASQELRADPDIAERAVTEDGRALAFVDRSLLSKRRVLEAAVRGKKRAREERLAEIRRNRDKNNNKDDGKGGDDPDTEGSRKAEDDGGDAAVGASALRVLRLRGGGGARQGKVVCREVVAKKSAPVGTESVCACGRAVGSVGGKRAHVRSKRGRRYEHV